MSWAWPSAAPIRPIVTYYDTKGKEDGAEKHRILWSELNISF